MAWEGGYLAPLLGPAQCDGMPLKIQRNVIRSPLKSERNLDCSSS